VPGIEARLHPHAHHCLGIAINNEAVAAITGALAPLARFSGEV
jgi:hypothetical protein